jgi:hypothetical protein
MNRIIGLAVVSSLAAAAAWGGGVAPEPLPSGALFADFNGDGFADLAIGAPGDYVAGLGGAGAINLIRGSAVGLTVAGDEQYHQDSLSVPDVAEAGDAFGQALAVGDFNGDGVADLAVGVPAEGVGSGASVEAGAGAVNVFYGWSGGYQLFVGYQAWDQDIVGVPGTSEAGDAFGAALAAGDFNCDLRSDLAVGVPLEDVGSVSNAGAVNVFYAGSAALTNVGAQLWHQDSPGIANGPQSADELGHALAAGDFDGDGCDDLAIGVPGEDPGGFFSLPNDFFGAVHVLYGGPNGLTSTDSQFWRRGHAGLGGWPDGFDFFGWSLAAGDFDGDGNDDLAIGGPGNAGSVLVLFGSGAGLTADDSQSLHQNAPGIPGTSEYLDFFGWSLVAADFDADGFDDLAIGVPFESVGAVAAAGAVNVNYGGRDGLLSGRYQLWHQDSPGVDGAPGEDDYFGYRLGAGDFNGDGFWDLAVGVPFEDVVAAGGSVQTDAGAVAVLYGAPAGLGFDVRSDQLWMQSVTGVEGDPLTDDLFGWGLAGR